MTNRWEKSDTVFFLFFFSWQILFSWATKSLQNTTAAVKLKKQKTKNLVPWKKSYDKSRQRIKKQRHYLANKGPYSQSYGFSSSHVQMWELDHKRGSAPKNWSFQTVVLEKTLESPFSCRQIKPDNPEGNQLWIFTGRMDAEAPILWPLDANS